MPGAVHDIDQLDRLLLHADDKAIDQCPEMPVLKSLPFLYCIFLSLLLIN